MYILLSDVKKFLLLMPQTPGFEAASLSTGIISHKGNSSVYKNDFFKFQLYDSILNK